jgi:hypothetical protein
MVKASLAVTFLLVSGGLAQNWEAGAGAGGGFYSTLTASNSAGRAASGISRGPAFSAFLGQRLYTHVSGEIRYTYGSGDLRLTSAGAQARFRSVTHALHYDVLVHAGNARTRVRPFLAGGGGFKLFRGTGKESAYQPLSNFALLTQAQEWKPLVSAGGGAEFAFSQHMGFRVELRDYMTPLPSKVIAPAPGAKLGGWLHELLPLIGLSYRF